MIPLRIVERDPENPWGEPGDVHPWGDGEWWIVLPPCPRAADHGGAGGCSWRTTDEAFDGSGRWTVTGTAPLLTVMPSIDVLHFRLVGGEWKRAGSCWHGWIRNGQIVAA